MHLLRCSPFSFCQEGLCPFPKCHVATLSPAALSRLTWSCKVPTPCVTSAWDFAFMTFPATVMVVFGLLISRRSDDWLSLWARLLWKPRCGALCVCVCVCVCACMWVLVMGKESR